MVSFLWILFDVAVTLRLAAMAGQPKALSFMTGPPSFVEAVGWGVLGLLIGVWALVSESREAAAHKREREADERKMQSLHDEVVRQGGFAEGSTSTLGAMITHATRTLESLGKQAAATDQSGLQDQMSELKTEIEKMRGALPASSPAQPTSFVLNAAGPAAPITLPHIVYPGDGAAVSYKEIVGGVCEPGKPLQVWLLALDNKYHLQGTIIPTVPTWTMECTFGNPNSGPSSGYALTAISGMNLPNDKQLRLLPDGFSRSLTVAVRRKANLRMIRTQPSFSDQAMYPLKVHVHMLNDTGAEVVVGNLRWRGTELYLPEPENKMPTLFQLFRDDRWSPPGPKGMPAITIPAGGIFRFWLGFLPECGVEAIQEKLDKKQLGTFTLLVRIGGAAFDSSCTI